MMTIASVQLDAALPWLESALDRDSAANVLAKSFRKHACAPGDWSLESATLVRHKIGRRALIEYVMRVGGDQPRRILLKCRVRDADRRTAALHDRLPDSASRGWRVPRALGVVPPFHGWLQEWCAGTNGFEALSQPRGASVAAAIGGALADLHSATTTERRHDVRAELAIATGALARVAEADSRLTPRLARMQERLARLANSIAAATPRLLHRDFYPDQVLVDGATIVVLDLDLHAMGDPALDLGNFVAHLVEHDLRTGSTLSPLGGDLVDGYRAAGGRVASDAINAYETLTLARHIALSTILPGRGHTTAALVDLCERRLAGAY